MAATDTIQVVDFRTEFATALVPMWRSSFEEAVGVTDPHPLGEQRAYLIREVLPHNSIRVALLHGDIVAFVAASSASIAQLYVHRDHQRRGIGTLLLDWAKRQSAGSLWLYTFARNTRARSFYERSGFKAVAFGFESTWQLDDVRYEWLANDAA